MRPGRPPERFRPPGPAAPRPRRRAREGTKGKIAHLVADRSVKGLVAPPEQHGELAGIKFVDGQVLPAIPVEVARHGRDRREARCDLDGLLKGSVPPAQQHRDLAAELGKGPKGKSPTS